MVNIPSSLRGKNPQDGLYYSDEHTRALTLALPPRAFLEHVDGLVRKIRKDPKALFIESVDYGSSQQLVRDITKLAYEFNHWGGTMLWLNDAFEADRFVKEIPHANPDFDVDKHAELFIGVWNLQQQGLVYAVQPHIGGRVVGVAPTQDYVQALHIGLTKH